jgi:hypothetical protein
VDRRGDERQDCEDDQRDAGQNADAGSAKLSAPTVSDLIDARFRQPGDLGNLRPGVAGVERGTYQVAELLVQHAGFGGDFTTAGAVLRDLRQAVHAGNICIFNLRELIGAALRDMRHVSFHRHWCVVASKLDGQAIRN